MEHTPLKAILDEVPIYPMWKLVDSAGNVLVTIEAEENDKEWAHCQEGSDDRPRD